MNIFMGIRSIILRIPQETNTLILLLAPIQEIIIPNWVLSYGCIRISNILPPLARKTLILVSLKGIGSLRPLHLNIHIISLMIALSIPTIVRLQRRLACESASVDRAVRLVFSDSLHIRNGSWLSKSVRSLSWVNACLVGVVVDLYLGEVRQTV